MANRCKVGLDYFPFDATFFEDDKIQLIHAEHGSKGVMVAIKLLCKIYKEGYFYRWGEDECLLFVKNAGIEFDVDFVNQVITSLLKRKFFDRERLEKYGILTSAGIQKRYFDATVRYKKIQVILEYLIIVPPTRENVCINKIDVDINPKYVYTNQHSNGKNNESNNENDNGNESVSPSSPPKIEEPDLTPHQGQEYFQDHSTGRGNFGDISPGEMLIPSAIKNCHVLYLNSKYFAPTREEVAMRHYIDEELLSDWVGVFVVNLTRQGHLTKTLKDFAVHFSNWLPKQDLKKTPKQALEYEQQNSNSGEKGSKSRRDSPQSFYNKVKSGGNNR